MNTEQYIEHEVKIRLHEHRFDILEAKLNFIIATGVTSIFLPLLLHWLKLI